MNDSIAIPRDFNDTEREILARSIRHAFKELLSFHEREGPNQGAVIVRLNVASKKLRGHKLLKEAEGFAPPAGEDS